MEIVLAHPDQSMQQAERHLLADDSGGLEEAFLLRGQPIDPCRQDGLHRGRHLQRRSGLGEAVRAPLADQNLCFNQRANALLEEEGIALGLLDQEVLDRLQLGGIPYQSLQELLGGLDREWVEPELSVIGLTAPGVLILRAVVDEQ